MTRFRHIPAAGRVIVVAVAVGVFAIAFVACATSYNAIYRLVDALDLYGYRTTQGFPLLVDAAFLVAESAAILGGIMRAVTRSEEVNRGWPYVAMWLCGLCTIAFNVWHAYLIGGRGDPLTTARCVVASLPPLLMLVSFQVLISIVKWVMLHLGRPLDSAAVLSPAAGAGTLTAAYAAPPLMETPRWAPSEVGQAGHAGNGGRAVADMTKREQVEAYLRQLDGVTAARLLAKGPAAAGREVAGVLQASGVDVTPRYVADVLNGRDRTPRRAGRR